MDSWIFLKSYSVRLVGLFRVAAIYPVSSFDLIESGMM